MQQPAVRSNTSGRITDLASDLIMRALRPLAAELPDPAGLFELPAKLRRDPFEGKTLACWPLMAPSAALPPKSDDR